MIENITDTLELWFDAQLENVHTVLPGTIVEYSGHAERKAKVQPKIKQTVGADRVEIKPIENVPVVFPSSSAFNMLYPLTAGDGLILLFSESGIGNYLSGNGISADADSQNRFSLTDCIAIPGLWAFKNVPQPSQMNDSDMVIQFGGQSIVIKENGTINIDGTAVNLNGATKPFVTHTELNVALQTLLIALNLNLGTKLDGAGTPGVLTLDISASATTTVKTGG